MEILAPEDDSTRRRGPHGWDSWSSPKGSSGTPCPLDPWEHREGELLGADQGGGPQVLDVPSPELREAKFCHVKAAQFAVFHHSSLNGRSQWCFRKTEPADQ